MTKQSKIGVMLAVLGFLTGVGSLIYEAIYLHFPGLIGLGISAAMIALGAGLMYPNNPVKEAHDD